MNNTFLKDRQNLLAEYSQAYYEGSPAISDDEFDRLLQEYVEAGGEDMVGHGFVPATRKVTHTSQMGSLEKERSAENLIKWIEKCHKVYAENCDTTVPLQFNVSPKFDGLAIAVTVENGSVKLVATRGDGFIGEDVTMTAKNVPTIANLTEDGIVTGEILLPKENLSKANNLRDPKDEPLTQIRNAASGIIRKLNDKNKVATQLFFANHNEGDWVDFYTYDALLEKLDDVLASFEPLRNNYPVAEDQHVGIDGVVFKVANQDVRDYMGSSSRCPRWAVAYKYADEVYESIVTGVDWGVPGKIGRITPVIEYSPIHIEGGVYTRATAHNITRYKNFAPAVGDKIYMKKSGDVIPFVVKIDNISDTVFPYPNECPQCGSPTRIEGEFLMCTADRNTCNPVKGLTFIITALGIKGIQEKAVKRIYDAYLSNETDLYQMLVLMKNLPEGSIAVLEGMGSKSESFIKDSLKNAWENAPLANWIYGLNIDRVGSTVSSTLEATYGSLDKIISAISNPAEYKEVTHLKGVNWDAISQAKDKFESLRAWMENHEVKAPVAQQTVVHDDFWSGKKVAITGSLDVPRADAEDWLKQHGATPQSSFSGSTDILIDAGDGSSKKSMKAREQNKTIVLGNDFMSNHYQKD